jgi:hypothetical protein
MDLQVIVDRGLPSVMRDAIMFECGATVEQTMGSGFIYEHHGEDFTAAHQGALTRFFEDVALGRRMPQIFATHRIRDVDTIFAMALFLNRDLVLVPSMVGLIAQMEMVHRWGIPMLAHLDPYTAGLVKFLRGYFPDDISRVETGRRIGTAAEWIREFVTEGRGPAVGSLPEVRVLERGTRAFVLAESGGDLVEGWIVLYSQGYARGVLMSPERDGRRQVVASQKSLHVVFDLVTAARLLNEVEAAMNEPPEWDCKGHWLFSPPKGTVLTPADMLKVFLRV